MRNEPLEYGGDVRTPRFVLPLFHNVGSAGARENVDACYGIAKRVEPEKAVFSDVLLSGHTLPSLCSQLQQVRNVLLAGEWETLIERRRTHTSHRHIGNVDIHRTASDMAFAIENVGVAA